MNLYSKVVLILKSDVMHIWKHVGIHNILNSYMFPCVNYCIKYQIKVTRTCSECCLPNYSCCCCSSHSKFSRRGSAQFWMVIRVFQIPTMTHILALAQLQPARVRPALPLVPLSTLIRCVEEPSIFKSAAVIAIGLIYRPKLHWTLIVVWLVGNCLPLVVLRNRANHWLLLARHGWMPYWQLELDATM